LPQRVIQQTGLRGGAPHPTMAAGVRKKRAGKAPDRQQPGGATREGDQSHMKTLKQLLCAGGAALALGSASLAFADTPAGGAAPASPPPPPPPTAPPYPSMGPTLSNNTASAAFDAGPLGKLTVNGDVSGMLLGQDNPGFDGWTGKHNPSGIFDLTNAMVTVQKDDGPLQFVVQAGLYSFPTLGTGYIKATDQAQATFGYAPVGYIKLVPNSSFSFQVGQLPTLIGAELPFTYQNANIERGLLWNTEPLFSRGIQANYSNGPWAVSVSWNDGYYSNEYTTGSGLITYTFKNTDTLTFAASGNFSTNFKTSGFGPFATPSALQQGQVYNLIYTHSSGPWSFTPYIQFNNVPSSIITPSGTIWAGAVIAKYSFNAEWSIAGRGEYESSGGAANLLYGPKSNAWSLTLTPTYQKGIFYARVEGSYTSIGSGTPGFLLGPHFDKSNQFRGLLEAGLIF
jgi:hypothetical protein